MINLILSVLLQICSYTARADTVSTHASKDTLVAYPMYEPASTSSTTPHAMYERTTQTVVSGRICWRATQRDCIDCALLSRTQANMTDAEAQMEAPAAGGDFTAGVGKVQVSPIMLGSGRAAPGAISRSWWGRGRTRLSIKGALIHDQQLHFASVRSASVRISCTAGVL